jgi:hypothetical protein
MKAKYWMHWVGLALAATLQASCSSGPVRRVSEPAARLQQLTVHADGSWSAQVRIENFSSIPMRFESLSLALTMGGQDAGTLQARPGVSIGPESADVVDVNLAPATAAKLAVADALGAGRSIAYSLEGTLSATPEDGKNRSYDIERSSALSPAPGLPGVLR